MDLLHHQIKTGTMFSPTGDTVWRVMASRRGNSWRSLPHLRFSDLYPSEPLPPRRTVGLLNARTRLFVLNLLRLYCLPNFRAQVRTAEF
jgi:hypothetical protein